MGVKYGMRMISVGKWCCTMYIYICIYVYHVHMSLFIYLYIYFLSKADWVQCSLHRSANEVSIWGVHIFKHTGDSWNQQKQSCHVISEPQWPCGGSEGNHCPHGREKKGTLMEGMGIDSWQ